MPALKGAICAGMLSALLISHRLWVGARSYPTAPVWPWLKPIGFPLDAAIFAVMLALLLWIAAAPAPTKAIAVLVGLAAGYALWDQTRWQPWFYQCLFMLAAWRLPNTCRLMVAAIYFWSGIYKINPNFALTTFPWMLEPVARYLPAWLGYAAAAAETGIAIALLTPRFRAAGVAAALAMHGFVLVSLGPLGHNYNAVIWPWNIAMMAFVVLLFSKASKFRAADLLRGNGLHKLVLALFAFAPALAAVGLWDSDLAFAMYSGNKASASIYLAHPVAGLLPEEVQESTDLNDSGVDELPLGYWAGHDLNVAPYPEIRVFKAVGRSVCQAAGNPKDLVLMVATRVTLFHRRRQLGYDCASLSR